MYTCQTMTFAVACGCLFLVTAAFPLAEEESAAAGSSTVDDNHRTVLYDGPSGSHVQFGVPGRSVKGIYTFLDSNGKKQQVQYEADERGYRVKTTAYNHDDVPNEALRLENKAEPESLPVVDIVEVHQLEIAESHHKSPGQSHNLELNPSQPSPNDKQELQVEDVRLEPIVQLVIEQVDSESHHNQASPAVHQLPEILQLSRILEPPPVEGRHHHADPAVHQLLESLLLSRVLEPPPAGGQQEIRPRWPENRPGWLPGSQPARQSEIQRSNIEKETKPNVNLEMASSDADKRPIENLSSPGQISFRRFSSRGFSLDDSAYLIGYPFVPGNFFYAL